ncbi:uncharacterized protein LOC125960808 [Orcinus orca]|uniref:uncharacterized protein LOC125960808 n=1 Tax=Orcinus orca TaxID=9733 RepID=UPI0021124AAA|nr:uncharacterized protein LOC125960808 [Orcinus orca]
MAGSVCCCVMWDGPPSLSEPVCFSVKWIMNPSPPTSRRCLENQRQTDCKGGFLLSLGFSPRTLLERSYCPWGTFSFWNHTPQPAWPAGCLPALITARMQTDVGSSMWAPGNWAICAGCQAHLGLHLRPRGKEATASTWSSRTWTWEGEAGGQSGLLQVREPQQRELTGLRSQEAERAVSTWTTLPARLSPRSGRTGHLGIGSPQHCPGMGSQDRRSAHAQRVTLQPWLWVCSQEGRAGWVLAGCAFSGTSGLKESRSVHLCGKNISLLGLYFFRTVLGLQQNRKCRDIPCITPLPSHMHSLPPPLSTSLARVGRSSQLMSLCYIIITQSPQSVLGFTLGVARSVGLDTI